MDADDLAIALAKASAEEANKAGGNSSTPTPASHPAVSLPPILNPRSTNKPGYKYKYPEAAPTPDGEDDDEWNKVYTAADSRFYNKHAKSATASKKYRLSGETYELAVTMMAEKKQKAQKEYNAHLAGGIGGRSYSAILPPTKATAPKPKPKTQTPTLKKEPSTSSRDGTPGGDRMQPLSISEQIKQEGRARKAPSVAPSSKQSTPAPSTARMESPSSKIDKSSPPRPVVKKKGIAAPVKKPTRPKQDERFSKPAAKSGSPRPNPGFVASDSESNDGGEYCICRGPDDHRMMVNCEGGCNEWYHCSCIGMDVEDAKELLDRYICPKCKSAELFTTWKRMCRYHNVGVYLKRAHPCRKAARVTAEPPSKYCSDEHRLKFMEFIRDHLCRQDDAPSMGGRLNVHEVGEILAHVKTNVELQALGQKPRLPRPSDADPAHAIGLDYITPEETEELQAIELKKLKIQSQIDGYKKQQKLLVMIHARGVAAAEHPDVNEKAVCGYDNRLAFNPAEFALWLATPEGSLAFSTGVLGPRTEASRSISARIYAPGQTAPVVQGVADQLDNICLKSVKSCVRHKSWRLIHGQDYAAMTALLQRELERCERKAGEIVEDAETREAVKEYHAH
ncbi:Set1 complex component spp1, partial [Lachnellula suecica]